MGKKWLTKDEARMRIKKYCAYQERAHQEVRTRLYKMELSRDWIEEIIVELIEEDYLNESRYAELFARSKMNQKRWGKAKIKQQLKAKGVSRYCLRHALDSLDERAYLENLKYWILKKKKDYLGDNQYEIRSKVFNFCAGKGYEYELIQTAWNDVEKG